MYGAEVAEIFELVNRERGRDYRAEAAEVARQVRAELPRAASLLDVACGAGSHLRFLAESFDRVEGLEISEPMLERARALLPGVPLHQGDMRDFDLGRRFDAVVSMTGSVGYMSDPGELEGLLRRFARHLAPGGVAVVDPWWFRERFLDGHVSADVVEAGGRTIARVSHSALEGAASRVEVRYVVADPGSGVRSFAESHLISLFTRRQYETAFDRAGFRTRYVEGVQSGRGLFVGVVPGPGA
ncbi:class I SAM-dependent methyltransferase [Spirillospora sp. NPDC050679]